MNFYPFHIGDYRSATMHLSNEEDLAYRRLLDMYYDTEQPIPVDTQWVSRRLRVDVAVVDRVLCDFFTLSGNGWTHVRCESELGIYKKMSEGGKAGAAKRWGKRGDSPPIAPLSGSQSPLMPTNNQEPLTKNQEKNTESQPDGFDSFWTAYPKKVAKPAALRAFKSAKINGHLPEVLADIESKSQSESWLANKGQFIPNPATYLNQRRWEDQTDQQSPQVAGAI